MTNTEPTVKNVIYTYQSNDINSLRDVAKDMASKAYMLSANQHNIEYSSVITSLPAGGYQLVFICRN